jgi:hypothetical protein
MWDAFATTRLIALTLRAGFRRGITQRGATRRVEKCPRWRADGASKKTCIVPAAKALSGAYEEGIAGMLTIIKASLLGSALMFLESCTGYLTSYQTPCVEGHVCECVQYTTVYRSWLDCRDYGRVKSRAY